MSDAPNPADFSRDEKPDEYEICFRVTGIARMTIKAADMVSAKQKAWEEVGVLELEDYMEGPEYELHSAKRVPPMYRVIRDGFAIQTGRLKAGDAPRPPNEDGF